MSNFEASFESDTISSNEALEIQKQNVVRINTKSDTSATVSSVEAEKKVANAFPIPNFITQQSHLESLTVSSSEAERITKQKANFLYSLFNWGRANDKSLANNSSPTISSYEIMESTDNSVTQTRLQVFTINIESTQNLSNPVPVVSEQSIDMEYCRILATDYKNPAFILNNVNTKLATKAHFILGQKSFLGLLLLLLLLASAISALLVILISKQHVLLRRDSWDALPSKPGLINLRHGYQAKIILTQTNDEHESCTTQSQCTDRIRKLQLHFMNASLPDIPYNFMVGDDGFVYEGRGFHYQGEILQNEFTSTFNDDGLIIAFIGNFNDAQPSVRQLETFHRFILQSVNRHVIAWNYTLLIQDQLTMSNPNSVGLEAAAHWYFRTLRKSYEFESNDRLPIGRNPTFRKVLPVLNRAMWNASEPKDPEKVEKFTKKITDVYITISAYTPPCLNQIFRRQKLDFDAGMNDIRENFFITPCGIIEGRGWDTKPESESDFLLIMIIGEMEILSEVLDKFLNDSLYLEKTSCELINPRMYGNQSWPSKSTSTLPPTRFYL